MMIWLSKALYLIIFLALWIIIKKKEKLKNEVLWLIVSALTLLVVNDVFLAFFLGIESVALCQDEQTQEVYLTEIALLVGAIYFICNIKDFDIFEVILALLFVVLSIKTRGSGDSLLMIGQVLIHSNTIGVLIGFLLAYTMQGIRYKKIMRKGSIEPRAFVWALHIGFLCIKHFIS